jgi:hypothetical protein
MRLRYFYIESVDSDCFYGVLIDRDRFGGYLIAENYGPYRNDTKAAPSRRPQDSATGLSQPLIECLSYWPRGSLKLMLRVGESEYKKSVVDYQSVNDR